MGLLGRLMNVFSKKEEEQEQPSTLDTYRRLMRMIELQAPELADSGRRAAEFAEQIASLMGMYPDEVETIRLATELRDIGYLRLPGELLNFSGELTGYQVELMRRHPIYGEDIVGALQELRQAGKLIRHHHERWDGSGYPDRLEGEEIPLGARVIAVADVFSAITSSRPFRNAYATADAVEYLNRNAGKLFDPDVVEIFVAQWEKQEKLQDTVPNRPRVLELRRSVPEHTSVWMPSWMRGWTARNRDRKESTS